jgi:hypothetical protein
MIDIIKRLKTILSNMEFMGTDSLNMSQNQALRQIKLLIQDMGTPEKCPCPQIDEKAGMCGSECTNSKPEGIQVGGVVKRYKDLTNEEIESIAKTDKLEPLAELDMIESLRLLKYADILAQPLPPGTKPYRELTYEDILIKTQEYQETLQMLRMLDAHQQEDLTKSKPQDCKECLYRSKCNGSSTNHYVYYPKDAE